MIAGEMESESVCLSDGSPERVTILVRENPSVRRQGTSRDPIDSSVLTKLATREREGQVARDKKVAPAAYVTNVSLASVCLCCTGQQARRCSLNVVLVIHGNTFYSHINMTARPCAQCSFEAIPILMTKEFV